MSFMKNDSFIYFPVLMTHLLSLIFEKLQKILNRTHEIIDSLL